MVEQVDTQHLKCCSQTGVRVRFPLRVQKIKIRFGCSQKILIFVKEKINGSVIQGIEFLPSKQAIQVRILSGLQNKKKRLKYESLFVFLLFRNELLCDNWHILIYTYLIQILLFHPMSIFLNVID